MLASLFLRLDTSPRSSRLSRCCTPLQTAGPWSVQARALQPEGTGQGGLGHVCMWSL